MVDLILVGLAFVVWVPILCNRLWATSRDKRAKEMQFKIDLWDDREDYGTTIERKGYAFKIREVNNIAAYKHKTDKWSDNNVEIITK